MDALLAMTFYLFRRCLLALEAFHECRNLHALSTQTQGYLNLILSRLDEQQRRWVAGREARRRGHGGVEQVAQITGLHPETIRIGRDELQKDLAGRPTDRVRLPGGGRPRIEKKTPPS